MVLLPFAGLAYTLSSGGPPTHFMVPTVFAAVIGFLSNLAIAECNGLIMETFDVSDLQPGMTGRRPRHAPSGKNKKGHTTNYSSFPRVSAAFALAQTLAFTLAAIATGVGGPIDRQLGAKTATGVVAAILLVLTILFISVLWRWKQVQVIPSHGGSYMDLPGTEIPEWTPVIIGNPSGKVRRMNLLELGDQSRWTLIRRRNRLS